MSPIATVSYWKEQHDDAERRCREAVAALKRIAECEAAPDIDPTGETEFGLHCGVEDRGCSNRYEGRLHVCVGTGIKAFRKKTRKEANKCRHKQIAGVIFKCRREKPKDPPRRNRESPTKKDRKMKTLLRNTITGEYFNGINFSGGVETAVEVDHPHANLLWENVEKVDARAKTYARWVKNWKPGAMPSGFSKDGLEALLKKWGIA